MTTEIDLLFFVEHVDRELHSVQRIASALNRAGCTTAVLSVFFHSHLAVSKYRAKVYVFPYVMGPEDWPVRAVREMYGDTVTYVNMNWEQLLSPVNLAYKRPRNEFQRETVVQIAWHEQFRQYLLSHAVAPDRVHVLGNPAHQILREQLAERADCRGRLGSDLGLDQAKTWVFFPMNYSWAFSPDLVIRRKIANGYDPQVAWEHRAFARRNMDTFIGWVNRQARQHPDKLFIVRPHPSVSCDQWEGRFSDLVGQKAENIVISKHLSVREWLPAADAVYTSWSTVAWDAYNAGIRAFLIAPYGRPDWLHVDWNDLVPNLTTEAAFAESLAAVTPLKELQLHGEVPAGIDQHAGFLHGLVREAAARPQWRLPRHWRTWAKLVQSWCYRRLFRHRAIGRKIDQRIMYDVFEPVVHSKA